MTKNTHLTRYWLPVFALLTVLIFALTIPITPVLAAFGHAPALDSALADQSTQNDIQSEADPADTVGQSIQRSIGCSQADLITAIKAANTSPGESVIDLPPGCIYQVSTVHNVDPVFRYNGFPLITSKITINGNGAGFTGAKPDIRPFQVAQGGELILNQVEFFDLTHSEQASSIVNQGILRINHSSFYNNQGRRAGVINNVGEAIISNSTFANNFACCCLSFADGGAIYNSGALTLINSTFADNRANAKGETLFNNGGTVLLKNSLITTKHFGDNCAGDPVTDGGGNMRWPSKDTSCVGTHGDPKLAPLANYGGLTKTMALQPGSPAIDTGVDAICAAEPVDNTSQNGVTRPHGQGCDIGAFEYNYLVVSSIIRKDLNPTNAQTVAFTVVFSQPVFGVDLSDFALTTTGIDDAALLNISGSGSQYTVTVNTGTESGTLRLDVIDDDSINDGQGNLLGMEGLGNGNFTTGEVYTIDKAPPFVESINRVNTNPTHASFVAFRVAFSEPVIGVDVSDFILTTTGLTDALILSILADTQENYSITVSTGIGNGTLRLDLIDNDSITDPAGNPLGGNGLGNGDFTIGEMYTVDKIPPVVLSITRLNETPYNGNQVGFLVTFSEPVTGVEASDFRPFTDSLTSINILAVTGSDATYTVTVDVGLGDGLLRLDLIDDDSIRDFAQNPLGGMGLNNGNFTTGQVYTIDRTPPQVKSIIRLDENPNDKTHVDFQVTFSEPVTGVGINDFSLHTDNLVHIEITAISGSGEVYSVTVKTGFGDGILRLDLIDDDSIQDSALNPLGGPGLFNGDFTTGEAYTIIDSPIFADVPTDHWAYMWIKKLYDAGITKGCKSDPLSYCPEQAVMRGEMAVFLLRGIYGSDHRPDMGTGKVFVDVLDHPYIDWIEQLFAEKITTGCKQENGKQYYCPDDPISRAEMAIFLLRGKFGGDYQPPELENGSSFDDVPEDHFAAAWINQLAELGITSGCDLHGNYCPDKSITRAEMAVFLVKTFIYP